MHRTAHSARAYARWGGALYLIIILAGLYGTVFVRASLVLPGDAAATAQKIVANETLFRSGIVGDLLMHVCDVPLTLIFYILLRPVSNNLSILAALFSMLQTAVLVTNKLTLVAVLLVLGHGSHFMHAGEFVSLLLALHEYGFGIGLLFFGFSCLVLGYLMYRSGYLPKALGALQAIAGLCYIINSLALLLAPEFAGKLFPAILLPAFVGELATCLWLLLKGIDVSKWPSA